LRREKRAAGVISSRSFARVGGRYPTRDWELNAAAADVLLMPMQRDR
jgi:hypothetical protein